MLTTTGPDGTVYTWHDDRQEILRIGEYCAQDVEVETAIDELVLQHSPRERRVWELDQKINDRGVRLDLDLARSAVAVIDVANEALHGRMAEVTGGAVPKCSQVAKLVAWINSRGIPCTSAAGPLQDDLILAAEKLEDAAVVEAIDLRRQSGKGTPTSKYQTMLDCANADGKARGQLAYSGATTTGRWAGRLIQFQNMPGVDEDLDGENVRTACAVLAMRHLAPEELFLALQVLFGAVLPVLSKCLRQMLVASPGCRFIGGDLSNIEGCTSAWIADETWKVEAYLEFQRTGDKKKDLYRVAFSRAFGADIGAVTSAQRQVGKVLELACGFGGSIGALVRMMAKYKYKPAVMVPTVRASVTDEVWEAAREKMKRPGTRRYGLAEDEWIAIRIAIDGWRLANSRLQASWYEVGDAVVESVAAPGTVVRCLGDRIAYTVARNVLWCLLPSGRTLAYHRPRLRQSIDIQVVDTEGRKAYVPEAELPDVLAAGCQRTDAEPRVKRSVTYEGYDGVTKHWTHFDLHGSLAYQNSVQAIARDVMVEGMLTAEARGYPIVLTVHDELLCDVPVEHGSAEELCKIMATVPEWCPGLPLAAKTWEGFRYEK